MRVFLLCLLVWSANASAQENEREALYSQLRLFGDVLERVRANHVDLPDDKKLIEAALGGMLAELDPHSAYLSPDDFDDMQIQTKGEFGGLGIEVTMENGLVKVIAPIDDTPAARAGILPNDLIVEIDDMPVLGLNLTEAVHLMRGLRGTDIRLTILRQNADEPIEVKLTRDLIVIKPVRVAAMGARKNIAYIRITTFNARTSDALVDGFAEITKEIGRKNLLGFVIDLRNNAGGLLEEAIAVSDMMLARGEIVSTRGRDGANTSRYSARGASEVSAGFPILILVNGGSASASEIVAGALQDHRRATIVGTQSFGKGSVQTIIPLSNRGALRLTTARYFTPSGRSIQALGIAPDIVIEQKLPEHLQGKTARREADLRGALAAQDIGGNVNLPDGEASESIAYVPLKREEDEQLQKTISLLEQLARVKR